MPRARLTLAIVVLAAIGIAIVWWRGRSAGPERPAASSTGPSAPTGPTATNSRGPERPPAGRGTSIDPAPAAGGLEPVSVDERGTRTYVMDNGAVVRDHRGPDYGPPVTPPPMPPGKRTMSSGVTAQIYTQLKPAVLACAAKVPAGERGADPFVYVTLTVAVTGGRVATTDVYPTVNDLKGPGVDGFTECVRKQGMAISVEQSGEPDRTDYVVQYPIRLP